MFALLQAEQKKFDDPVALTVANPTRAVLDAAFFAKPPKQQHRRNRKNRKSRRNQKNRKSRRNQKNRKNRRKAKQRKN